MKQTLFALLATIGFLILPSSLSAQDDIAYWGKEDAYLLGQATHMFNLVDEALSEYPPTTGAPTPRRLALYNLDAMLHETKYDNTEPFYSFVASRMAKVIEDMQSPHKRGIKIYKIYNDGFVARSKSATIAFDLVRGACNGKQIVSDKEIEEIVKGCDVLFLTHNHSDHVDNHVVNLFIEQGKPIVAATEILADVEGITHYRSEEEILDRVVVLKNGESLDVKIYPGHQSDMMCNVYAVTTPEGYTVAHTGDQYNKEDFEWIATVKNLEPRIDALLINCWTMDIAKAIEGFNPRYVLTGHENEMGHTIDHREAFWLTFQKLQDVEHDYVVMAWGEWFTFK